jgi:predicted Zn-dependent protease
VFVRTPRRTRLTTREGFPLNDIISAALNAATLAGASYADVRVVDTSREAIQVASGTV